MANNSKSSMTGSIAKPMPYKPGTGKTVTLPFTPGSGIGAKTMPYYPTKQVASTRKSIKSANTIDARDVFEKALDTGIPLRKAMPTVKPKG